MSASRRSEPPDPASAAQQYSLSNHTSPVSTASMPGFGNWERIDESIQETVSSPTHVETKVTDSDVSSAIGSGLRSAEASVPARAVKPGELVKGSSRDLTTGIAAATVPLRGSTAFCKLYKICILLHRCNLKFFAKNQFEKLRISQNF